VGNIICWRKSGKKKKLIQINQVSIGDDGDVKRLWREK
jgi:hypothetical protein